LPAARAAGINDLIELTHQMPHCPLGHTGRGRRTLVLPLPDDWGYVP
jgi:hypothetical protein